MREKGFIKVTRFDEGTYLQDIGDGLYRRIESKTDWARVDAMTEEEIEANALSDPDNPPITDEELSRMRPSLNPRLVRQRLHLTQEQFATQFQIPLGTLRDWEQGVRQPYSAARTLLRVINHDPQAVLAALK